MSLTPSQCKTLGAVLESKLNRCVQSFTAAVGESSAKDGDPLRTLDRDLNRAADAAGDAVQRMGIFAESLHVDLRRALRQVIRKTLDVASLAQVVETA